MTKHIYNLKKYSRNQASNNASDSIELFSTLAAQVITKNIDNWANSSSNLHVGGYDVLSFFKEVQKAIEKEQITNESNDSNILKLLRDLNGHYHFRIYNRQYACEFVETDSNSSLAHKSTNLVNILKSVTDKSLSSKEHAGARLALTLCKHILEKGHFDPQTPPTNVNPYLRSDIVTWNQILQKKKDVNARTFASYPFVSCMRTPDMSAVILLIVTRLDKKFIDSKVTSDHFIEPCHMYIFGAEDSDILFNVSEHDLSVLENKIRYMLGYVNSTICASVTDTCLKRIAKDTSVVSKYWYSETLERLFSKDERFDSQIDFLQQLVDVTLCEDIEGLEDIEIFPFDRAYVISGSNDTAYKKGKGLIIRILEVGIKSERPMDKNRYLTVMERLDSIYGDLPDMETEFDLTDKDICEVSDLRIDDGDSKTTLLDQGQDSVHYNYLTNHNAGEGHIRDGIEHQFNTEFMLSTLKVHNELVAIHKEILQSQKLGAVIASLFSGKEDQEKSQDLCQETYQYYDEDGLCFLSDFGVREISTLDYLEDIYIENLFAQCEKTWSDMWKRTPSNIPKLKKFSEWQKSEESKVILVSFDPRQHEQNMDSSGDPYLSDKEAFTIILVADSDISKNNYHMDTELDDLRYFFKMFINRNLHQAKNRRDTLAKQRELIASLLPTVTHRIKNIVSSDGSLTNHKREMIDSLIDKLKTTLGVDKIQLKEYHVPEDNNIFSFFFGAFLQEQVGPNYSGTEKELEQAIHLYQANFRKSQTNHLKMKIEPIKVSFHNKFIPSLVFKVHQPFITEACNILLNNAVEHAVLHAEETGCQPFIDICIYVSDRTTNQKQFEIRICNNSSAITLERLNSLNAASPREVGRLKSKMKSTGMGVSLARTQLQYSIGSFADIKYENVNEKVVGARLLLPVEVIELKGIIPEENEISSEVSAFPYVLYIEDEPPIRDTASAKLRAFLHPKDYDLVVTDNLSFARTTIKNKAPEVVISDFTFFKQANGSPSERNGITLVDFIVKNKLTTPVIILTSKTQEETWSLIESKIHPDKHGYTLADEQIRDVVSLLPNTIYYSSDKDLSKEEGLQISKLALDFMEQNKKFVDYPAIEVEPKQNYLNKITTIQFGTSDLDKNLGKFRKRNISEGIPNEFLILKYKVSSESDFHKIITQWLNHPGLPSFHPHDLQEDEREPLHLNEVYRFLVFVLECPQISPLVVDASFKYWALAHNFLVTTQSGSDLSKIPYLWQQGTSHGLRGVLSQLRHDLRNKVMNPKLEKIIDALSEAEKTILFKDSKLWFALEDAYFKDDTKKILALHVARKDQLVGKDHIWLKKLVYILGEYQDLHPCINEAKESMLRLSTFLTL